jgi:hypothetical protein
MAKSSPYRPFVATKPAVSLVSPALPTAPPSERVVAAVLEFGDVRDERQDGLTLVRFSADRLEHDDLALLLADERTRAMDISILWNEAECEMVRVIDLAPLRAGRQTFEQANRYAEARQRSLAPTAVVQARAA